MTNQNDTKIMTEAELLASLNLAYGIGYIVHCINNADKLAAALRTFVSDKFECPDYEGARQALADWEGAKQ